MTVPVENPQGQGQGTGAPENTPPAPEPPTGAGVPPVGTETPPLAPSPDGLPSGPGPDGLQVSGRGSNQDRPPTPAVPATPSPQAQPGTPPEVARQEVSDLPDWAQKLVKDARDEAAKSRVNAKSTAADEARKAMTEDIGRALGIITDDTPAEDKLTPDQLKELLTGERTTARGARTELAVFKAALGGGAFNAQALLDSRSFLDSIKDIDPTDGGALAEKITAAVTAQPWLAQQQQAPTTPEPVPTTPGQPAVPGVPVAPVPPVAPPSGGSFAGGPGAQPQDLSTMSIDDFRKLRRTPRS